MVRGHAARSVARPRLLVQAGLLQAALLLFVAGAAAQTARPAGVSGEAGAVVRGPMLLATPEGERLLRAARADLLAFRLDGADSLFAVLDAHEPSSPAGAYGRATVAFWRSLVDETPARRTEHAAAADALEARAAALPAAGAAGTWRTFFEAEVALQRAVIAGRDERYLPAATSFRRACGRYADLLRTDPTFEDAYLGAGACHVAAGQIPRKYRWIARLLGFSGTMAQGTAELERAAEHAVWTRETALTLRSALRAIYSDDDTAAIAAEAAALRTLQPESPLAAYIAGFLLVRARRASDAEVVLREAAALSERPGVADLPTVDALLGLAMIRQERYAEGAASLERFLDRFEGASYVAQVQLTLGIAREMDGDRRGAESAYRRVRARRDYDNDRAAEREARRRLQHPMDVRERSLLRGQFLFDGGHSRDAIAAVQPIFGDDGAAPVQRAEAAYRTGRAHHALGEWADAARYYRLAADNPGDPAAKWGPWSRFHLGEVLERQGDTAGAREAYRAVLDDEHEFDFHQALEQRARAALEGL